MRKLLFLLATFFFLGVTGFYLSQDFSMKPKISLGDQSYMDEISITQKKDGAVKWALNAKRAEFLNNSDVKLAGLKISFPEKGLVLTSEGGLYNIEDKNLEISGHINASTKDYEIVAARLYWDATKNELLSDDKVKIVGRKFALEGEGLVATKDKAKLNSNVKAVFGGK